MIIFQNYRIQFNIILKQMNSQEDQSQIAQENIIINSQQPIRKYITFHDIQKYQSQYIPITKQDHECRPVYIQWKNQKLNQFQIQPIQQINPTQWIIQKQLNPCCFNFKVSLDVGLGKRTFVEIFKIRKINVQNVILFDQQGVKYRIEHVLSSIKIQTFITKQHTTKIWKQIQIPVKSYQVEVHKTLSITEQLNGDIVVIVDQFEFMLNAMLPKTNGLFFIIKSQANINRIVYEEIKSVTNNPGCTEQKCVIF